MELEFGIFVRSFTYAKVVDRVLNITNCKSFDAYFKLQGKSFNVDLEKLDSERYDG